MIRSAAIKGYLLVTGMRDAQQLQAEVPDSQLVTSPKTGASILALPHTLAGATRLSRLGIDAPSPILSEYVWTGRFPPYAHQRVTSDFMTKNPKCIVLSDMATGKTASAMWAADYLMKIGAIRTVLVLSPLSCVNRVWMDELFKWIPHRAGTVVRGGRDRRKRMARESQSPFLILNHDGLKVVAKEIIQRGDIDLIIVDEASVIRNAETARYRLFVQVAAATRARLWLLTGTPTPNAPTDAWALGRLINREGTHWSFKKFRNHTMIKISQFRWVAKKEAKIIVRNVLQPGIRFKKSECLDLPETVPIFRECAMSKEQTKAYKEMRMVLLGAHRKLHNRMHRYGNYHDHTPATDHREHHK